MKADLESALKGKSAEEWSNLFNKHGVPAGEVPSIPEILEHPQITERSLIKHFQTTPGIDREIAVVRAGFRLVTGDPVPGLSTPLLAADTEKILEELGYDGDSMARLRAEGAVRQCYSYIKSFMAPRRTKALFSSFTASIDDTRTKVRDLSPIRNAVQAEMKALAASGVTCVPGFGHRFHPTDPRVPRSQTSLEKLRQVCLSN